MLFRNCQMPTPRGPTETRESQGAQGRGKQAKALAANSESSEGGRADSEVAAIAASHSGARLLNLIAESAHLQLLLSPALSPRHPLMQAPHSAAAQVAPPIRRL